MKIIFQTTGLKEPETKEDCMEIRKTTGCKHCVFYYRAIYYSCTTWRETGKWVKIERD